MEARRILAIVGTLALVLAACGPATVATPTAQPTTPPVATQASRPTQPPAATVAPTATVASRPPGVTPVRGGTLRVAHAREPAGWDPFKFHGGDVQTPLALIHNRLFRYSNTCSVYPALPELAESWKWTNDTTLDVKLRSGIRFPNLPPVNGRELVADDLVYVWRVQAPRSQRLASLITFLDRIEAPDRNTVRFYFKEPYSAWVEEALTEVQGVVVAKETFGPDNSISELSKNLGLGPYLPGTWGPGVKMTMSRNPNYWRKDLPHIDNVEWNFMPQISTQLAALRSGKLDFMNPEVALPTIQEVETNPGGLVVYSCPHPGPVIMTMRVDQPPFNDVRVRRAISMAIDRKSLLNSVYLGKAVYAYSVLLPGVHGDYFLPPEQLPAEVRKYIEYRPEDAKRLLQEAGYPKGFTTTISYTNTYGAVHPALAESLVDFLARIGIEAKLDQRDYGRFVATVLAGDYPGMALHYGAGTIHPDRGTYQGLNSKSPQNRGHLNDPTVDSLTEQQRRTADRDKLKQTYHDLQIRLTDQAYQVVFPMATTAAFATSELKGVKYSPHWWAWADYLMYTWLERK